MDINKRLARLEAILADMELKHEDPTPIQFPDVPIENDAGTMRVVPSKLSTNSSPYKWTPKTEGLGTMMIPESPSSRGVPHMLAEAVAEQCQAAYELGYARGFSDA